MNHVHHWVLATPEHGQEQVTGVCACGASRDDFPVYCAEDMPGTAGNWKTLAKRRKQRSIVGN